MTKKDFNWDESTWGTKDYRAAFENFKEKLQHTSALYYPDYDAEWLMLVSMVWMQCYYRRS